MLGNRVFLIICNITKLFHRPAEHLQFSLKPMEAVVAQLFSMAKTPIGSHTGWRTSTAQIHHPTQAHCALLRPTLSKDTCYMGNTVTECDNHSNMQLLRHISNHYVTTSEVFSSCQTLVEYQLFY